MVGLLYAYGKQGEPALNVLTLPYCDFLPVHRRLGYQLLYAYYSGERWHHQLVSAASSQWGQRYFQLLFSGITGLFCVDRFCRRCLFL